MTIPKTHNLAKSPSKMSISSFMQETMCFIGQFLVFKEAEQVVNTLSGSDIYEKQIERICHFYGNSLENKILNDIEVSGYEVVSPELKEELHYVSIDGSMLLTREEKWKEIKLARIYKDNDIININKERNQLIDSQYVVHLGGHLDFIKKLEYKISDINNKVFVCDGAKWIWSYVDLYYPESVQILDYYHAKEHLCDFAKKTFKDDFKRKQWIEKTSDMLINEGVNPVIKTLEELNQTQARDSILNYYRENQKRMQYHDFKAKNYLIGSGAIESAHKDVLQKRLKLSGQRWTKDGIQQMANLRVCYKSNNAKLITQMCKMAA